MSFRLRGLYRATESAMQKVVASVSVSSRRWTARRSNTLRAVQPGLMGNAQVHGHNISAPL